MEDDRNDVSKTAIDPTYGLRSALPDIQEDGDETSIQALAYLREVRLEANGIPHLLVAEGQLPTSDDNPDVYAWYEDGTFAAADNVVDEPHEDDATNQELCYEMLRTRFNQTRSALNGNGYTRKPPFSMAVKGGATYPQYSHAFLFTAPRLKEIAALSQADVMQGLIRFESLLTKRNWMQGDTECRSLGAWGWALLAKCRVPGQMDSEDMSVVREVGKTAIKIMKKIQTRAQEAESNEDKEPASSAGIGDVVVLRRRELAACAGLDSLITIIGEEFGQRDLLNAREVW